MTEPVTQYGSSFAGSFANWLDSKEFSDVTIVTLDAEGREAEWPLHALLLAHRSMYFHRAFSGGFAESRSKTIKLHLEASGHVWSQLVEFFYTDKITISEDNVMPLMALARQLLVATVDGYCSDFVASRLCTGNCLHYLCQAVRYQLTHIQQQCITLAAQGFHFLYDADVAGLPPATVLEILQHEELLVHCEAQVLHFVLRYLASTQLDAEAAASICSQVRFPYLDNATLASLSAMPAIPKSQLLEGCILRLGTMDTAAAGGAASAASAPMPLLLAAATPLYCGHPVHPALCAPPSEPSTPGRAQAEQPAGEGPPEECGALPADGSSEQGSPLAGGMPAPRSTYCCDMLYRLPGGYGFLTVEVGAGGLWEALAAQCTVHVSGISEGRPENVLSADPQAWFETDESADPLPWVEVRLPHNVTMVKMSRYSFAHGHRRSGYFRMRNWRTQVAPMLSASPKFSELNTRVSPNDQFEVHVATNDQARAWQVLRLAGSDRQEDAMYRLCLRNLRVAGVVRINLMEQEGGLVVTRELMQRVQRSSSPQPPQSQQQQQQQQAQGRLVPQRHAHLL